MATKKDPKKKAKQKNLEPEVSSKPEGRKQTLPAMLLAKNSMPDPNQQTQTSIQLEDYNALERLLEAGTPEDLDTRTELNELQVLHFARAEIMAEYYNSATLRDFVASIKRKQISLNRRGRREFTEAIKGALLTDGEAGAIGMRGLADRLRS